MRAYTKPLIVASAGSADEQCQPLEGVSLRAGGDDSFSEHWLQMLLQRNPSLLPIDQIEPALTPAIPICVELPLPSGYADNLFLTPDGGIVLVETKLWRNPEARREVIAQIIDYAKDLSRFSCEDLQRAVRTATKDPGFDLFRHVAGPGAGEEDEARFRDAVSRNLRLGRMLLIIAGDGVQENLEDLTGFVQRHMGLHFALALVEIGVWRIPGSSELFVQPKIITRTVQIERGVVRIEEGVSLSPAALRPAAPTAKPNTLSGEQFYETLGTNVPGLPDALQRFLTDVKPLGVYADIKRNLNLKWRSASGREFSLGAIDAEGRIGTDYANYSAQAIGRVDLAHAYQDRLVAIVPGASVRKTQTPAGWRVIVAGQALPVTALLQQKQAWIDALADYIQAVEQAVAEE